MQRFQPPHVREPLSLVQLVGDVDDFATDWWGRRAMLRRTDAAFDRLLSVDDVEACIDAERRCDQLEPAVSGSVIVRHLDLAEVHVRAHIEARVLRLVVGGLLVRDHQVLGPTSLGMRFLSDLQALFLATPAP